MAPKYLGEFEQMVLLAVLRLDDGAWALAVLGELEDRAGRTVSRGTLYKTLERLEAKGMLDWTAEDGSPERGGHPRRRFTVTRRGVQALREARETMERLWDGLDGVVGEPGT